MLALVTSTFTRAASKVPATQSLRPISAILRSNFRRARAWMRDGF